MVRVRERRAADTAAVRRVARTTWRATYGDHVPAPFIRTILRRGYDRRRLVESLADRRRDAFVAVEGGDVVGYADVVEDPPGQVELVRIYVLPKRQGEGAGRRLLERCVRAALARRAVSLKLGVDPQNARAIAWYERRGFLRVGDSTLRVGTLERPVALFSLPVSSTRPADRGPPP